jgi:AraC-like DNA-binding protein
MEEFFLKSDQRYDSNIQIVQCGWEECCSKHSHGPAVRDHYLIHYVISGKGCYHFEGKVYELSENQGFLISPDDVTYYEADAEFPWVYVWVGFNGLKAAQYLKEIGLERENPIFSTKKGDYVKEYLFQVYEHSKLYKGRELGMLGSLYHFLAILAEETEHQKQRSPQDEYLHKACQYIEMNYSREISVIVLAAFVGLDRSYFSNLFKSRLGESPQKYIIKYRMSKACEMIRERQDLNIGNIARSVGYPDPLLFSKMFKTQMGCSPSAYRRQSC